MKKMFTYEMTFCQNHSHFESLINIIIRANYLSQNLFLIHIMNQYLSIFWWIFSKNDRSYQFSSFEAILRHNFSSSHYDVPNKEILSAMRQIIATYIHTCAFLFCVDQSATLKLRNVGGFLSYDHMELIFCPTYCD